MTTTELIKLLQHYEKGAVSGRSREISLVIDLGEDENLYLHMPSIQWYSSGDGLLTTLDLFVKDVPSQN